MTAQQPAQADGRDEERRDQDHRQALMLPLVDGQEGERSQDPFGRRERLPVADDESVVPAADGVVDCDVVRPVGRRGED